MWLCQPPTKHLLCPTGAHVCPRECAGIGEMEEVNLPFPTNWQGVRGGVCAPVSSMCGRGCPARVRCVLECALPVKCVSWQVPGNNRSFLSCMQVCLKWPPPPSPSFYAVSIGFHISFDRIALG